MLVLRALALAVFVAVVVASPLDDKAVATAKKFTKEISTEDRLSAVHGYKSGYVSRTSTP